MQVAAQKNLWKKQPGETIHWFVYEPPYKNRWVDDSEITLTEWPVAKVYDTPLHKTRKAAANAVIKKGASNYLHRIQQFTANHGIRYHGIKNKGDIWTELAKLPDGSVSRFWYSGHAAPDSLLLSLSHFDGCSVGIGREHVIESRDIGSRRHLAGKFKNTTTTPSKFYGCNTSNFAKKWHDIFSVPTEGATNKITFSVIGKSNGSQNILQRLQSTATTAGPVGWKSYP